MRGGALYLYLRPSRSNSLDQSTSTAYIESYLIKNSTSKEDMGTKYLVRLVARVEDEEDASDFEQDENGEDDDNKDEDVDDDESNGGKIKTPSKRKRSNKDYEDDDSGEDDERPS
ncbi:transcription initiation factor TFIID subunit 11-like [Hibiscus syriacus]|uniref:transcription initiation factor TFIID subunit 11-like n=1 Tax=Hibiscus syriacus TaxID=106335 RepID=UPI001923CD0F|nr:transcription initiation factor TFIID subunit 11-like [Hibiscus syriacus]